MATAVRAAALPGIGWWRPFAAAGLSLVLPGAGHLYAGRRMRAIPFLVASALSIIAGLVLLSRGTLSMVEVFVQPRWVWAVIIGNGALAVLRLWAAVDAYGVAGGWAKRPPLSASVVALLLLGSVLIVPHVFVGVRAAAMLELLGSVFVGDQARGKHTVYLFRGPPPRNPIAMQDSWMRYVIVPRADGSTGGVSTVGDVGMPPILAPMDGERVTVLLAGGDAGPGRAGLRTDVIMVATMDLSTNKAYLITISRELVGFPVPPRAQDHPEIVRYQGLWFDRAVAAEENGTSRATEEMPEELDREIWLDRINALHPRTQSLGLYRGVVDPGLEALSESVSAALGLHIDYYAMVDMGGFVDFVDAIGGVRVTSRETVNLFFSPAKEGEEMIHLDIEPGVHHLDGRTALAYVRNRTGTSDLFRTRRQRCMVRDLAGQIDAGTVVRRFDSIARAVSNHMTTNIPLRVLPSLVTALGNVDRTNIGTMAIDQTTAAGGWNYRSLPVLDIDRSRQHVRTILEGIGDPESEISAEC